MVQKRMLGLASAAVVVACADAPVSPAKDATQSTPVVESDPAAPVREITLSLLGRGTTTEWMSETPSGDEITLTTEIEAATREIVVGEPVDTLLAISFSGAPALGRLTMTPPTVLVQDVAPGIPIIFLEGSPSRLELAVFIRQSGFPARQFVQTEPATLEVIEYVAPARQAADGRLRAQITFVADEYYREWSPDGSISVRRANGKVRIKAHLTVQLAHRVREAMEPVVP